MMPEMIFRWANTKTTRSGHSKVAVEGWTLGFHVLLVPVDSKLLRWRST